MNEHVGQCFVWVDSDGVTHEIRWKCSNDSLEDATDETLREAMDNGWTIPRWSQKARREETYWKWDDKIRKRIRVFCKWYLKYSSGPLAPCEVKNETLA